MTNKHAGSSFDDFLKEDEIYEESTAIALKRMLAWQLEEEMKKQNITKKAMAERLETSRSQLDRLLDPLGTGVSLETMQRAANVLGRKLRIELV
ncbi:MAG: XRE family transcriptional regulator [Symploca sp. SIO3E6]|nr:XRE family transcriptional regulator [Caldora sp. SIO3E6]NET55964.1 XRE family transcriptional regulator [Symploca sp. SIO2E6]